MAALVAPAALTMSWKLNQSRSPSRKSSQSQQPWMRCRLLIACTQATAGIRQIRWTRLFWVPFRDKHHLETRDPRHRQEDFSTFPPLVRCRHRQRQERLLSTRRQDRHHLYTMAATRLRKRICRNSRKPRLHRMSVDRQLPKTTNRQPCQM